MTSAGLPPKPISMGTVAGETRQGSSQRSRMRQRKIVGRANALKSLESYILSPAQSLPDLANMSLEREEEAMHSLRQEHNFIANSPTIFKAGRPSLSPEDSGQNSSFSNNSSTLSSALSPETPDSAIDRAYKNYYDSTSYGSSHYTSSPSDNGSQPAISSKRSRKKKTAR